MWWCDALMTVVIVEYSTLNKLQMVREQEETWTIDFNIIIEEFVVKKIKKVD